MTEGVGFVRAEPVEPYRSMGTHDDHAVDQKSEKQWDRKIAKNEKDKKRKHANCYKPAHQWNPIPAIGEYINPGKSFFKKLFCGWLY